MRKVLIIIPAYNEEKRIGKTLEAYSDYFREVRKRGGADCDMLIVINNTTDRTLEIVREFQRRDESIKCLNFKRGGKGFAVLEGFKYGLERNYELIGFVDADMATSPEEYYKLIISLRNSDGVIADRYMKGSMISPAPSTQRLLARKMFNFVIRSMLFLPYGDTQCGAKLFKRRALEQTMPHLKMSQWAFDVDLLYNLKRRGFRVRPFPTSWVDKEYSKINFWQAGPWMALAIVRLRMLNSPMRRFVRVYDKLIGFIPK